MIGPCPAVNNGGLIEPANKNVFTKDSRKVVCNDIDGYYSTDVKGLSMTDPRGLLKYSQGSVECYGTYPALTAIPESGIVGSDTIPRFIRVADPLDAQRKAYLMRLTQGDPVTSGSHRTELVSFGQAIARGKDLWIAFAFLTPSAWKTCDRTLTGNPNAGADETLVWQIHDDGDVGDDAGQNPNIAMILTGGGAGTPGLSKLNLSVRTSSTPITTKAGYIQRTLFQELDYPADVWQYWVINCRMHWDIAFGPYFKAYRRIGYTGPWTQVVDDKLPNQYNNIKEDYQKHGIYYYPDAWTGGITSRLLHSKGLYTFQGDGVTFDDVTSFLDGV